MREDRRAAGTTGHAVDGAGAARLIETIRVRDGRAPLIAGHQARLTASSAALEISLPSDSVAQLVAPWLGGPDRVVRIEFGGGRAEMATRAVPAATPLSLIVAMIPHRRYPHKITTRTVFEAAVAEARAAEVDDALLVTADGLVAEGTTWNIFWWEPNRLVTPPLSIGVLPGVARSRIQGLVPVAERTASVADLRGVSLFATSAVRGVVPIARLDGTAVPVDSRSADLARRFWAT